MRRLSFILLAATLLLGFGTESKAFHLEYSSRILGNALDSEGNPQEIAGFQSSFSAWTIRSGKVTIFPFGSKHSLLVARVRGLVLDPAGFNPSPTIEARVVCHDRAGDPFLAATTKAAPLKLGAPGGPAGGNGELIAVIQLPDECFAPIVLFGGDSNGGGPPGFFAVTGL